MNTDPDCSGSDPDCSGFGFGIWLDFSELESDPDLSFREKPDLKWIKDDRSLLFLTPTPLLLRQIQLRLQSDSENFSNIILQLRNFQSLGTNVVTSKSYFTLASFLVSILKFDTRL